MRLAGQSVNLEGEFEGLFRLSAPSILLPLKHGIGDFLVWQHVAL